MVSNGPVDIYVIITITCNISLQLHVANCFATAMSTNFTCNLFMNHTFSFYFYFLQFIVIP